MPAIAATRPYTANTITKIHRGKLYVKCGEPAHVLSTPAKNVSLFFSVAPPFLPDSLTPVQTLSDRFLVIPIGPRILPSPL